MCLKRRGAEDGSCVMCWPVSRRRPRRPGWPRRRCDGFLSSQLLRVSSRATQPAFCMVVSCFSVWRAAGGVQERAGGAAPAAAAARALTHGAATGFNLVSLGVPGIGLIFLGKLAFTKRCLNPRGEFGGGLATGQSPGSNASRGCQATFSVQIAEQNAPHTPLLPPMLHSVCKGITNNI